MCEKCAQLDERLQHYRDLADQVNDKFTKEAVERLTEQYTAQKLVMHPEPKG
jgi:quinolinate synthase